MNTRIIFIISLCLTNCSGDNSNSQTRSEMREQPSNNEPDKIPNLFVEKEGKVMEAPAEDIAVANRYTAWKDKGAWTNGRRITLLCEREQYQRDEEIRVLHVLESRNADEMVYVTGPKNVFDEYVDQKLQTKKSAGDYPWITQRYRGKTVPAPAVDFNYEITTYSFSVPGTHTIEWRLGDLSSNTLNIEVTP